MELFNASFEKAVLSSLLFASSVDEFDEIMSTCKQEYFYFPDHQNIFFAIKTLNEKKLPIDEEFIKKELEKNNCFNASVMLDIIGTTPIGNTEPYMNELKEFHLKHTLLALSTDIKKRVDSDECSADIEKHIESLLMDNDETLGVSEPMSIAESIKKLETMIIPPKLSLGIEAIDKVLCGGLESAQLIHIGGEENVGKTTLTKQILCNISNVHKCLFFSFEMPAWKLTQQLQKKRNFNPHNFFIVDSQMMNRDVMDVVRMIRRWHRKHNIRFVMIDSKMKLQHASFKGYNEADRIGNIDSILAALANELDINIMVITQLSKEDKKAGTMSGYGSAISDYETDMKILLTKGEGNQIGFQIKKNRQEVLFDVVPLWFDLRTLEFSDTRVMEVVRETIYGDAPKPFGGNKVNVTHRPKKDNKPTESEAVSMPILL